MINITFIKKQLSEMELSTNKLKDITGIGYATLSDYLNKPKCNISAKHYVTIINTLFTPFEQLLYANAVSKAQFSKFSSAYWYDELKRRKVKHAIETDTIDIQLSGAVASDDDGVVRSVPANVNVIFKDIEGKTSIRIFDDALYRKMGSAGQRIKKELLLKHLEDEKENNKVFEFLIKNFNVTEQIDTFNYQHLEVENDKWGVSYLSNGQNDKGRFERYHSDTGKTNYELIHIEDVDEAISYLKAYTE